MLTLGLHLGLQWDYNGITKKIIGLQKKCWDYIGITANHHLGLQMEPSGLFSLTVDQLGISAALPMGK